ncbi:MAG: hypothetical protein ACJ8DC_11765 [Gemmatimonadales bacterium]
MYSVARLSIVVYASLALASATAPTPGTAQLQLAGPTRADRSAASGIPFGLFGMKGRNLVDPYTSAVQPAKPEAILGDLAAARARGARIVVNFAGGGGGGGPVDAYGHFDYDSWKALVDRFRPIADQLNGYVADGTLFANLIIDEPSAKKRWGGDVPTATLDQMAEYSKSLFPKLTTAVREGPRELQNYSWRYLDASWAQYTAKRAPVGEYVSTEAAAARAKGLGLIVGLNISKGGDGSSGLGKSNEWSMTGKEILQYGHALLDTPDACAFLSWDSRPNVIDRPEVAAALQELAAAAKAHPATSCRGR